MIEPYVAIMKPYMAMSGSIMVIYGRIMAIYGYNTLDFPMCCKAKSARSFKLVNMSPPPSNSKQQLGTNIGEEPPHLFGATLVPIERSMGPPHLFGATIEKIRCFKFAIENR